MFADGIADSWLVDYANSELASIAHKPKISTLSPQCVLCMFAGGIADSWLVDYQATKNVLDAAREAGANHFVLLSAICVQRPLLEFQKAKLKFEAELQVRGGGGGTAGWGGGFSKGRRL